MIPQPESTHAFNAFVSDPVEELSVLYSATIQKNNGVFHIVKLLDETSDIIYNYKETRKLYFLEWR